MLTAETGSAFRRHNYMLTYSEAGKIIEKSFRASSRCTALAHAKYTLGIPNRLTVERFTQAGGIKLTLGNKQVYPHGREPHPGGGK
jgi:hypothetical protein